MSKTQRRLISGAILAAVAAGLLAGFLGVSPFDDQPVRGLLAGCAFGAVGVGVLLLIGMIANRSRGSNPN